MPGHQSGLVVYLVPWKKKEKKEKTELKKTKTTNKSLQVSLKLKMARLIQANNWGVKFSDCTSFEGIFSSQTSLKEWISPTPPLLKKNSLEKKKTSTFFVKT